VVGLIALPEGRKEDAFGSEPRHHSLQAQLDLFRKELGEERLGEGELEAHVGRDASEVEVVDLQQPSSAVREAIAGDLDLACGGQQLRLLLDPVVVARLQVADEVDPAAQRAAADVEEEVARLEPLCHEEVELELAELIPEAADVLPVPVVAFS
jgi:hypothetical protein